MDLKRYTKLFNYGYFLSKYEPQILKNLLKVTKESPELSEPLKAGNSQFEKEKFQEKLKGSQKSMTREKGKEF